MPALAAVSFLCALFAVGLLLKRRVTLRYLMAFVPAMTHPFPQG